MACRTGSESAAVRASAVKSGAAFAGVAVAPDAAGAEDAGAADAAEPVEAAWPRALGASSAKPRNPEPSANRIIIREQILMEPSASDLRITALPRLRAQSSQGPSRWIQILAATEWAGACAILRASELPFRRRASTALRRRQEPTRIPRRRRH